LNATFVKGKMTTSRMGTIGKRSISEGIWSVNSCILQWKIQQNTKRRTGFFLE